MYVNHLYRTTTAWAIVALAWVLVAAPLAWGVFNTLSLALQMVR